LLIFQDLLFNVFNVFFHKKSIFVFFLFLGSTLFTCMVQAIGEQWRRVGGAEGGSCSRAQG